MIHFDRLLRLADFLDTVPPEKFDFNTWYKRTGYRQIGFDLNLCGTTACALGWATQMPEFAELGLKFGTCQHGIPTVTLSPEDSDKYDGFSNACIAAEHIFGLNEDETAELFTPDGYQEYNPDYSVADLTAKDVAGHIRNWVDDHR